MTVGRKKRARNVKRRHVRRRLSGLLLFQPAATKAGPVPPEPAKAAEASEAKTGAPESVQKAPPASAQSAVLEQQQSRIFLGFIDGLAQQALMQLGELENPYTGQASRDGFTGRARDDRTAGVILAKTKGNLTETEDQAATGVLKDLKTHFAAIAQEMAKRQMALQAAQRGDASGTGRDAGGKGNRSRV